MLRIHGHEFTVRLLEDSLRQGRFHHAYLLSGPAHVGKTTLAVQLAQALNCREDEPPCGVCASCRRIADGHHADLRTISLVSDDGTEARTLIGIETIRDLQRAAYMRPYEGTHRVFIIQEADRLSAEAANALLKVLEEPPPDLLWVLLTSDLEAVLPTIASRCQAMELRPLSVGQTAQVLQSSHQLSEEDAERIARLSRGCVGWALQAAEEPALLARLHQQLERLVDVSNGGLEGRFAYAADLAQRFQRDRAQGREQLHLWLRWWRDVLLVQQDRQAQVVHQEWREALEGHARTLSQAQTVKWIDLLYQTLDALEHNANPRLALEAMMLELPIEANVAT